MLKRTKTNQPTKNILPSNFAILDDSPLFQFICRDLSEIISSYNRASCLWVAAHVSLAQLSFHTSAICFLVLIQKAIKNIQWLDLKADSIALTIISISSQQHYADLKINLLGPWFKKYSSHAHCDRAVLVFQIFGLCLFHGLWDEVAAHWFLLLVNSDKRLVFVRHNTSTSKYDGCIHSIQFFLMHKMGTQI